MRYAILHSGMSFRRHVNGLEFSFRTLVDHLSFDPDNIRVFNYDGSLRAFGEEANDPIPRWPGDKTPYRMKISGEGSCQAFRDVLVEFKQKLKPDDLLFINITGHGGHHGDINGPDLILYPYSRRYKCRDLCSDLASLPQYQSLIVLMSQCFSGGFIKPIISASTAKETAVSTATAESRPSFMDLVDRNWDAFQRNWISALSGYDVDGRALTDSRRYRMDHAVSVRQAFEFASACRTRNIYDSPQFLAHPESAGYMTLAPDAVPFHQKLGAERILHGGPSE